ncbi:MAG: MotA/TolQ/ExbB proton channel family protein, partial [Planctomycetota bacterium]
ILLGLILAGGFYCTLFVGSRVFESTLGMNPLALLNQYFLGHPISVAAGVLFGVAIGMLVLRFRYVSQQRRWLRYTHSDTLTPESTDKSADATPNTVALKWIDELAQLPRNVARSLLCVRLHELLDRQSCRATTKQLADDQRELSARDSDAAHDSLALVRIIVWAIPMLGFLGTVIGITQALGGLDFTDGAASVERLKAGLYTAFDTTALGLVLSVLAIFLQYPVEKSEQGLLADIDARVGQLLSKHLPSGDNSSEQHRMLQQMASSVQTAVQTSLVTQADLWRRTIDEAHQHWQTLFTLTGQRLGETLREQLQPALAAHASSFRDAQNETNATMHQHLRQWQQALEDGSQSLSAHQSNMTKHVDALADQLNQQTSVMGEHSDRLHAATLQLTDQTQVLGKTMSQQSEQAAEVLERNADASDALSRSIEQVHDSVRMTRDIAGSQTTLSENLRLLQKANETLQATQTDIANAIENATGGARISDAMRTLAKAVELLSDRLPRESAEHTVYDHHRPRRAA